MKSIIIAEAGVNHEGDIKVAFDMMYAAKWAGAQLVKWQLYNPEKFISEDHPLYEKRGKIFDVMLEYKELVKYAKELDIRIGFSIFTDEFWKAIHLSDFIKIAARQLDDQLELSRYLKYIKEETDTDKYPLFCSYREDQSLDFIEKFEFGNITYMGVISKYPHSLAEGINLVNRTVIERKSDYMWGISSHCPDFRMVNYASEKGAPFIEVHVTLDHNQSSFRDHQVGFDFEELAEIISQLERKETTEH